MNIPSDAEDLTEHQLSTGRSHWPLERNIKTHTKLGRMKAGREKEEENEQDGLHPDSRGAEARVRSPYPGQLFRTERKHLRLSESEAANLWKPEWCENHTDNLDHSPLYTTQGCKSMGMHSGWDWSVGIGEQYQGKNCCWLWGDSWGDGGKEIHMGNALGGKLGGHGGRALLRGVEPSL